MSFTLRRNQFFFALIWTCAFSYPSHSLHFYFSLRRALTTVFPQLPPGCMAAEQSCSRAARYSACHATRCRAGLCGWALAFVDKAHGPPDSFLLRATHAAVAVCAATRQGIPRVRAGLQRSDSRRSPMEADFRSSTRDLSARRCTERHF